MNFEIINLQKISKQIHKLVSPSMLKKRYNKINTDKKKQLISDLLTKKISLEQAAAKNKMNLNSAKFIWQQYKTKNHIKFRKVRIVKKKQEKAIVELPQAKEGPFHTKVIEFSKSIPQAISYQQAKCFFTSYQDLKSAANNNNNNNNNMIDENHFLQISFQQQQKTEEQLINAQNFGTMKNEIDSLINRLNKIKQILGQC